MKKSKIVQINNSYIQNQREKSKLTLAEKRQKNRFMASILILVVFLFILPTYNLVQSYQTLKDRESQLVELENQYQNLVAEQEERAALVKQLENEDFAAKYVRAKYQWSKEGEFIYNIPGILPQ
ncbi:septum formation initiator family protein [Streptococcus suis]|uniref:Septum formation initiator family protein n=2 Tax=Streptococcus TaxID=1301 RepID=A0A4T2GKT0_STRSU|nr:septum formation initiator family protein [Streptococcus sp. 29896]MBL6537835.1 septum formation initiator family protein [Streptococcus suis]MBM7269986.1 septum formation initiator family protein [Streptococcus suis]MBM7314362.1 septum formation initiator family protein [Streptococcus suis]MCK4028152.1 septum formation initiator family protein [Streptococcus suis]TIH99241.1 septum formation initiator family protein [Streptococcus suis]